MGIDNESRLCLGVKLEKEESSEDSEDFYSKSDVLLLYSFLKGRGTTFAPSYITEGDVWDEDDMDFAELISKEWQDILELVNEELKKSGSMFRVRYACPSFDCDSFYVNFYLNYKPVKDTWEHEGISLVEATNAFNEINVEEMNTLLKEFGIKEQEPRLFSLPHVY